MAVTKASYYSDEGPEIPSAGGDYGAPTPHAAKINQKPFTAPSGDAAVSEGFAATDNPRVTTLGPMTSPAPGRAQAAFDGAGEQQDF
jgi:hypothetical protein